MVTIKKDEKVICHNYQSSLITGKDRTGLFIFSAHLSMAGGIGDVLFTCLLTR